MQENLCAHKGFNVGSRHLAYLAEHCPLLADYYALVACFFAENGDIHVDNAVFALGKLRDLNGCAVGDLLIKAQKQLFTHKLGAYLFFGLVGYHIIRE